MKIITRKTSDKFKPYTLYFYTKVNGEKIRVKTRLKVDATEYNVSKNIARDGKLKTIIDGWLFKIQSEILTLESRGTSINNEIVQKIVNTVCGDKPLSDETTITYLFDQYMKVIEVCANSQKTYKQSLKNYKEFIKSTKTNDYIERYSRGDFKKWVIFLKETKGLSDRTVKIYTACIKKIINLAYENELIAINPTNHMKYVAKEKIRTATVIFTETELKILERLPLSDNHRIKMDLYLMLCYTGLRYSDMKQVMYGTNGKEYEFISGQHLIIHKSQKTGARIMLPCAGIIKRFFFIVERYNGIEGIPKFKSVFGFTRLIKLVFKSFEYPEYQTVCSHMARKNFATLLLASNVPISVASKLLSHATIMTTMKHYEKTSDALVWEAMMKV